MSHQETITTVQAILKGILNPDNNLRNQAAAKLEKMRQNTGLLITCLVQILHDTSDKTEKTVASVLIRKILEIKDDQVYNAHWKALSPEEQQTIKTTSLKILAAETDYNIKLKITDAVVQIASNVFNVAPSEQSASTWPDIMKSAIELVSLEANDSNSLNLEIGLRLFEGIYGFIHEAFTNSNDKNQLKELYNLGAKIALLMKSTNLKIASRAVKTISEMTFYAGKKELKQFKDYILDIMKVTFDCLSQNKENELKTCCKAIIEMSNSSSAFLFKPHFTDLFILMGKITEKNDFDDEHLRELGFEVIIGLIEVKPNFLKGDDEKTKVFVEAIYKYGLTMEKEITDDWATPNQDSYFDEELIYEKEVASAVSFLERLVDSIGEETMLPVISQCISGLIENTQDWRYKYVGIMSFKQIIGHCDDMVTIDKMFPVVFENTGNPNSKIRYACLSTIEELADTFKPHFSDKYGKELIPIILNNYKDSVLKVQLEACECLNTIMTNSDEVMLSSFSQSILDQTFAIFMQEKLPNNLRECLLNSVACLVSQTHTLFQPYAPKCLKIIVDFFVNAYANKVHKPIYGNLLECITLIGPHDKDYYYTIVPDLVDAIVAIQDSVQLSTDPVRDYLQDTIERLAIICKESFKQLIPKLIDSTMKLVKTIPEMSLSNSPDNNFKLDDLISSANSDPNEVKIKTESIKTTSSQEIASALETLNKVIEVLDDLYLPYVDVTNKEVFFYLNYLMNEDLRQIASDTIPLLLKLIKNTGNKENITSYGKLYTSEFMKALEKEPDNETLGYFLENFVDLIEIADGFLQKEEVNQFFEKIMVIFDDVEKRRLKLLEKKSSVENDILQKKTGGKQQDEDDSEDDEERLEKELADDIEDIEEIQSQMADLIGKLFATHKSISSDVVNVILQKMIPKYFRDGASVFENRMGMYLICDIVEYLGQEFIPENIWNEIAQALIKYSVHEVAPLRQPALYGMGMYAQNTKTGFEKYSYDFITKIYAALNIAKGSSDEEEYLLAKDNAIASLGRIIKFQNSCVRKEDIPNLIQKWLKGLPIEVDENEMVDQHEFLCDILLSDTALIVGNDYENAYEIVTILARVYKSNKFSEEKIDNKIKQVRDNILKTNDKFKAVIEAYSKLDEKSAKRANKLINE